MYLVDLVFVDIKEVCRNRRSFYSLLVFVPVALCVCSGCPTGGPGHTKNQQEVEKGTITTNLLNLLTSKEEYLIKQLHFK